MTIRVSISALAAWALGTTLVFGQTGPTTGAINGKVTDKTGAVLPGVSVTISSPSLMGTQSNVTDAQGLYRFPALPPGVYKVVYELAGFAKLDREGVRISTGFTATLDAEIEVASVAESVTVIGGSPVIDTQATHINTNFDSATLAALPSGARDMWAILAATPGISMGSIDVGGNSTGAQKNYYNYGTTGQHRPTLEGMLMQQIAANGAASFYYDYGSFAEMSVGAAANGADMPTPGVQMQFVSKSGGNQFHGVLYSDYENMGVQAHNISAGQVAAGAPGTESNRLVGYRDFNADSGGPLKHDALWSYFSFRRQLQNVNLVTFPVKPFESLLTNYTLKLTGQASKKDKLIAYYQLGKKYQPNRQDSAAVPSGIASGAINLTEASTWIQDYGGWVGKGEWDRVVSDDAFFELRAGQMGYNWPGSPYSDAPRKEDVGTHVVSGGNRTWEQDIRRNQVLGSYSWFKRDWLGTHNFKFGGNAYRDTSNEVWNPGYPNSLVMVFNNSAPIQVYQYLTPQQSVNGLWVYSAYATDTWNPSSRLTLNVGGRFDRYRAYFPVQDWPSSQFHPVAQHIDETTVKTFNRPAPRVGIVYKITSTGHSVIKMNAGRYWWDPDVTLAGLVNPNTPGARKVYAWSDISKDGVWEPGEEGRLISTVGGTGQLIDPNLKDSYTDEIASWFEHQVAENIAVHTGVVWRGQKQRYQSFNVARPYSAYNIPIQVTDPATGSSVTLFNLDPSLVGVVQNQVMNSGANDDYYTWEISADRHMAGRWSLLTAFSKTWSAENQAAYAGNTVRSTALPVSPNDVVNTVDGRFHFTTWEFKLSGTYEAPWGLRTTANIREQAGQPYGRTFVAALNYGSQVVLAEPIDSHRQDDLTIVDLRAEKQFRLPHAARISAIVDVYNLLNTNAAQNINWATGPAFEHPLLIVSPRIGRVAARLEW